MNIKTITDKLIEKSDADLKRDIKDALEGIDSYLRDGSSHCVTVEAEGRQIKVRWWSAMDALEERAFQMHYEKRRQEAIDNFMQKVESLTDELQEIQAQIQ